MINAMNKVKLHRGIDNHGDFVPSPFALLWLSRMGLIETFLFVNICD